MKLLALLAVMALLTGCSRSEPEPEPTAPAPTTMTAPLRLGEHVRDQLEEQKKQAEKRKQQVDRLFEDS